MKAKIPGPGVMRAGEGVRAMSWGWGTIRVAQDF